MLIYSYSVEGRGGAVAFDCIKQRICSLGRHLLLVYVDDKTGRSNVTIYDMKSKYVAFTMQLPLHDSVSVGRMDSCIRIFIHALIHTHTHTYRYLYI